MKSKSQIAYLLVISLFALSSPLAFAEASYTVGISMLESIVKIRVEADGSSETHLSHTWQIESEKGVNSYGEEAIAYSSSNESIEILEAKITQPDGSVHLLGPDDMHDKADSLGFGSASFSDTHYKVIVYPMVEVGSQLHYKVRIKRHTPDFPGHFTYSRYFAPWFRFEREETFFEISQQLPIKFAQEGGKLIRLGVEDGYVRYRHLFSQSEAVPSESGQIAYQDYAPFIMATTFADHIELGRAYQQRAKPMAAITPDIQTTADQITAGLTDQKEQSRALYHWVASNIRYVYIGLGDGGLVPQPADLVLKNRYGDCKGHVVLLEALLAAKGISSSPALISSGDAYRMAPIATLYPFNHVITYIPSLDLYLDPTAQMTPFGYLPLFTMDKPVILTALDQIGRTPILNTEDHSMRSEVKMRLLVDGSIVGTSHTRSTGWMEDDERQWHFDQMHGQHRIVQQRLESYRESGKGQIKTTPPQDFSMPFSEHTEFKLEPMANIPGPAALSIPSGPLPFALRDYVLEKPKVESATPVYCFSRIVQEIHSIDLPENIHIKHIPKDMEFKNRLAHYTAKYLYDGKTLTSERSLSLNYPDYVCDQADKQTIAELMDAMRKDLRAQLIYE